MRLPTSFPAALCFALAVLPGCKKEQTQDSPPAPAATAKPEAAAAAVPKLGALAADAVKVMIRVHTDDGGGRVTQEAAITDGAKVAAMISALGAESQPKPGALRRCPDTVSLELQNAAGKRLALFGVCNATPLDGSAALEGPELDWGGTAQTRGALVPADEPALRKLMVEAIATIK